MFFFTLVTEGRAAIFAEDRARSLLHKAISACAAARPFAVDAMVLLPDHLHLLIELPQNDANFSTRIALIKSGFTRAYLAAGGKEQSTTEQRRSQRRRGVWQRWFWEHQIRDTEDLHAHRDYIHYNPVKHGLTKCPHAYPYSTFTRAVAAGLYEPNWLCACNHHQPTAPSFAGLSLDHIE